MSTTLCLKFFYLRQEQLFMQIGEMEYRIINFR